MGVVYKYTDVNVEYGKLAKVVGRTSTVARYVNLCPIHTARQTRQDGPVCVVSGGVN